MTTQRFGEFFQNDGYQRTVRFLQKSGVSRDQATEIAQAAWVKGWERISQLRDENFLVEWVITIARRLLLTSFRQSQLVDLSQINREPAVAPSFNPAAIDMMRALPKCKPRQRELVEALLAGHSNSDIATQTGKSVDAIHTDLCRARQELREQMHVTRRQVLPRPGVSRKKVQQEVGTQSSKVSGASVSMARQA